MITRRINSKSNTLKVTTVEAMTTIVRHMRSTTIRQLRTITRVQGNSFSSSKSNVIRMQLARLLLSININRTVIIRSRLFINLETSKLRQIFNALIILLQRINTITIFIYRLIIL